MRSAIYYMLRDLGVTKLVTLSVGQRAMTHLAEDEFDIVLLGHNGRESTTGIQLLEEARYRGYMRPTTGWIFMTSDASQEVILHVIDSRPDELLTKPFSREELRRRLVHLIRRKRLLRGIDEALERDDQDAVLTACDRIDRDSPVYDEAQLIRARTLIKMGHSREALQMLERKYWETPDKEVGASLAEALMTLERHEEADATLQQLIETYPLFIQAYDLLARVQETQGDLVQATGTLHEATQKSPLGVPRQMELGRVATQSSEYDIAKSAFKRSITLGKHSCYRSPDPFLRLANISRLQMKTADKESVVELHNEIESALKDAEASFPGDSALKVKTALLRNQMYQAMDDEESALKAMKEAEARNMALEQPLNLQQESHQLGYDSIPVLQPIKVANVKESQGKQRDPEMSAKINRLGIKHYVSGKRSQAIRYFGMATEYDPSNVSAFLNLAQLFLESSRDEPEKRDERLRMVDRYLKLTERMQLPADAEKRRAQLEFYREEPADALPAGSLGVLLY